MLTAQPEVEPPTKQDPEVWLRLTYPASLWQGFAEDHRPDWWDVPLIACVLVAPLLLLVWWQAPALLRTSLTPFAAGSMLLLSCIYHFFRYRYYWRLHRVQQPHVDLGPDGYRLPPDPWRTLRVDYYRYRACRTTSPNRPYDLIVISRSARTNDDSSDRWYRITIPVAPADLPAADAFIARFNAHHTSS